MKRIIKLIGQVEKLVKRATSLLISVLLMLKAAAVVVEWLGISTI